MAVPRNLEHNKDIMKNINTPPQPRQSKQLILPRILDLKILVKKKSFLLLGPRQTGKTTLLKNFNSNTLYISLLDPDNYLPLLQNPSFLKEIIRGHKWVSSKNRIVIIDEIQKIPILLDLIQLLLDDHKNLRFILTGSSARKLKKSGVNLLGGRLGKYIFFPLVSKELEKYFSWKHILQWGGLPPVILSDSPQEKLKDYVDLYLKEEIQAEALTRNLMNFSRFLKTAAMACGEQLNYEKVANDAQIPSRTVKDYFQILEDTLIGIRLEPYRPSVSRKFVSTPKFYFFDCGITNYLNGREKIVEKSIQFGKALEHFIFCEIFAYIHLIKNNEDELFYWRTQTQLEVDFVVKFKQNIIGIEVKSSERVSERDFKSMNALSLEVSLKRKIFITMEKRKRQTDDNNEIFPVQTFLDDLWNGDIF
ncbi:MAG: ATP-binding protein [Oligoflexia bacterium]|nr:ATP-binding protein [Oligoflexia bacterium]